MIAFQSHKPRKIIRHYCCKYYSHSHFKNNYKLLIGCVILFHTFNVIWFVLIFNIRKDKTGLRIFKVQPTKGADKSEYETVVNTRCKGAWVNTDISKDRKQLQHCALILYGSTLWIQVAFYRAICHLTQMFHECVSSDLCTIMCIVAKSWQNISQI